MFKMTEEQDALWRKMTSLHKAVLMEHLNGHTHTQVWRRVRPESKLDDHAASNRVLTILKRPHIRKFIETLRMEKLSDAIMSREEALAKLSTLARGNMSDLVEFGEFQVGVDANDKPVMQSVWVFKDSALLDPKQLATIAELTASRDGFKIKQHSSTAAIAKLSEILGWNAPVKVKSDHTSSDGSMTPKENIIDASKLSSATLIELLKVRDESNN